MNRSWWSWVSPDGLTAVEIDTKGCWLRQRGNVHAMWDPPELMEPTAGSGTLLVSDLGVTDDTFGEPDVTITFPISPR
jgi:hypothetical protein